MAGPGKLVVRLAWDGATVERVEIVSSRPQAARLLKGAAPERAVSLVPLLFSLCGRAQGAAAQAAVGAAQGCAPPHHAHHAVSCEAVQEHLWRLLLDWPQALGLPAAREDFVRWHARLRHSAETGAALPPLAEEIGSAWLGMPCQAWLDLPGLGELQSWWRAEASPAARLFAALERQDQPACGEVALLPALAAKQAQAHEMDAAFAAAPQWAGAPAETGALARHARAPLLQDVLRMRPSGLLARLLARAYDMLSAVCGTEVPRVEAAGDGEGSGLGLVHTARGLLLHRVRLQRGRVAEYCIVAPTEWNFHPAGALARALQGYRTTEEGMLRRRARQWVLALDPCVACEVELRHA